jgi:hypothetical protein
VFLSLPLDDIQVTKACCPHQAVLRCVYVLSGAVQLTHATQGSSVSFRRRQSVNEVCQSGSQGVAKRPVVAHDHVLR